MPGYEERAGILQGAGAVIFNVVCERSTPEQWAEWLRVPLEHAAGKGDGDLVQKLLKAGADGSAGWKGCDGKSLLHAAAEGGNEQVVSALVRAGANKDMSAKTQYNGRTPLHVAVRGGHVAAAKVLMLAGADVNVLDAGNDGPLHLAIRSGHEVLAKDLLLRGADPSLRDCHGHFPIHLAARRGQKEVVGTLLHAGVQVNRFGNDGWTALFVAVRENHLSTVKALLDSGANTATLCDDGTPLHLAAHKNNADILTALVEAGADVEARNDEGHTPLHWAASNGSCAAMLGLLRLGANVHAKSTYLGGTPLHFACQEGKLDAADLLLRWGGDETTLDRRRRTPSSKIPNIAEAAEQDRPRLECLSRLLESAPQDRAWRRRGMLVVCRAHPDRLRLVVEIADTAEARGQPQRRPNRRARRGQVKVEVTMGGARNAGAGGASSSSITRRRARSEGVAGGFDGVAAWLMALSEESVFRKIVGFL